MQRFFVYLTLVVVFTVGWVLKIVPFFKSFVSIAMCKMTDTSLPTELYWDSLFTWKMLQNVYHCVLADKNKKVKLHGTAYNSPVVSLDGKRCHRLLDFARGSRPLVLNFGSSTCPVFMQMLKRYQQLKNDFSEVADFAVVYIEEAHPVDGWAFKVIKNTLIFSVCSLLWSCLFLKWKCNLNNLLACTNIIDVNNFVVKRWPSTKLGEVPQTRHSCRKSWLNMKLQTIRWKLK